MPPDPVLLIMPKIVIIYTLGLNLIKSNVVLLSLTRYKFIESMIEWGKIRTHEG